MKYKTDVALKDMGAYDEAKKHDAYKRRWMLIGILPAVLTAPFMVPLYMLLGVWGDGLGHTLSFSDRLDGVFGYFQGIGSVAVGHLNLVTFLREYFVFWLLRSPGPGHVWNVYFPFLVMPMVWILGPVITVSAGMKGNPFRKTPNIYGDARWATEVDIERMGHSNLIGFENSLYGDKEDLAMSLFTIGYFKSKQSKTPMLLRMGETLSILLLAPPGTGKTAGFIVPSAVSMDNSSLFLHDQKPELFDMTSGHRAKLGPVFQLKWSAQNAPEGEALSDFQKKRTSPDLLLRDAQGEPVRNENGEWMTKPIFYPSWNPLSPKSMPGPGMKRDLYIDRLVNVLCPAPKSGDAFWADKGRVALLGIIHFLVAKVDYATHPLINGGWEGIPEHWHGREASFPMLIDWYSYIQNVNDVNQSEEDPMRAVFKTCVDEARRMDEKFNEVYKQRVLNRAIAELTSLMNAADKTRSSILQTMDASLNAFKNAAVAERTSTSDFAFNELRGMPIPTAKAREQRKVEEALLAGKTYKPRYATEEFRPVTVYISIPAEDAKTFATLTGIFVDAANAYLVANGPGNTDDQGNQNGPYSFGFLLDEAPQLPKLDTVMNGPAVGRSKKVFYVIVGQDFGQFAEKYSKDEVGSLKSITAIKLLLTQNNDESARQVTSMVGKTTVVKHNYSPKGGGGGQKKGLSGALEDMVKGIGGKEMSASESFEAVDFIKPDQVMSLPRGKHIAVIQNFANRPLLLDTPLFYKDDTMKSKVFNLNSGTGLPPTTPMPQAEIDMALQVWKQNQSRDQAQAQHKARRDDPRIVVVISPEDLAGMQQTEMGSLLPDDGSWSFCELDMPHQVAFLAEPAEGTTITTRDPQEAARIIAGGRTLLFDRPTLERLNAWLDSDGQPKADPDLAVFLDERAADTGEEPEGSLYNLGFHGTVRMDKPNSPEEVTPDLAVKWVTSIMTFVLGFEEQARVFDP